MRAVCELVVETVNIVKLLLEKPFEMDYHVVSANAARITSQMYIRVPVTIQMLLITIVNNNNSASLRSFF
jgi:hypothetical protein